MSHPSSSPLPPLPKHPIGEVKIWLTGMGLALGLVMIFGLLGIILSNGLETFWPKSAYSFTLKDPKTDTTQTVFAQIVKEQERRDLSNASHTPVHVEEYQLFTGAKQVYGQAYRYVDKSTIIAQSAPEDLLLIERLEGGNLIVRPIVLKSTQGDMIPASSDSFKETIQKLIGEASQTRESIQAIEKKEIGTLNKNIGDVRTEIKLLKASYDFKDGTATPKAQALVIVDDPVAELKQWEQKEKDLISSYDVYAAQVLKLHEEEPKTELLYTLGDGQERSLPVASIVDVYAPNALGFFGKLKIFIERLGRFVYDEPREANTEGGIFPAIFGTFVMTVLMSALVTPIGVIAAIYLREYARQGTLVQIVRICVNNLAGVPSIVFGVFGLGFFVYFVGGSIDQLFFWKKLAVDNTPTFGTSGIIWASLTLALMTLPVVIVATEEALTAVPRGLREAALACGASKWQMIQRIILPGALPGILTGLILAMARGAGEVAPLMVTGVVKLAPALPFDLDAPFIHLERKFMHLGFHIYDVGFQSPDSDAAQPMVFATTLLLIILVVVMNLAAILIRNHIRKKYQTSSF